MKLKYGIVGAVLAVILVCGILALKMSQAAKGSDAPGMTKLRMSLKVKGPDGAPIKIIEFSDFQCGACRKAQPVLDGLEKAYPDQIQIVFKHFPLPGHTWSGMAHQAAECANQRGVFWPYMSRLFEDQEKWMVMPNPVDQFLQYAAAMNLNVDTFAACMMDSRTRERVRADFAEGEKLSIKSTPTFFIDRERMVGLVELEKRAHSVIRQKLGLPPLPEPAPSPSVQTSAQPQPLPMSSLAPISGANQPVAFSQPPQLPDEKK